MLRAMKSPTSLSQILHPLCPEWSRRQEIPACQLSRFWRSWLYDKGSLTARLSRLRPGTFRVESTREAYGRPTPVERRELGLSQSAHVWYREVTLYLGATPVVYARTAVPLNSLTGANRRLQHLGNRSLGSYLFSQPSLKRSPLRVSRCADNALGLEWCRRSVFHVHQRPLMVTEAFSQTLSETA